MKKSHKLVRRIVHAMVWVCLVYYFLPDRLLGFSKDILLLALLGIILVIEAIRLYKGYRWFGMREYEEKRIAAYAWASIAASLSLLFFPMHLVAVCLVGMGIVDPMIGELQHYKPALYPIVPSITWFICSLTFLTYLTAYSLPFIIIISGVGMLSAVAIEYPDLWVDDDFLMVILPLITMRAAEAVIFLPS